MAKIIVQRVFLLETEIDYTEDAYPNMTASQIADYERKLPVEELAAQGALDELKMITTPNVMFIPDRVEKT